MRNNSRDGTQAVSPEAQSPSAQLRDRRKLPEGVVPKQAQGYVVAGLAVLILMAVMFSKNHAKPVSKEALSPSLAASTDVNQRKIQELEQNLSADQRQSQLHATAQKNMSGMPHLSARHLPRNQMESGATPIAPPTAPPSDPLADAEKELAFKARFASNLVSANDGASHPSAARSR